MRPVSDVETYTLLLRDISAQVAQSAVITGKEGVLDGLSLATFFAGVTRASFPGGIYLVAPRLSELNTIAEELFDQSLGRKLLILSDANFGDSYSMAVDSLINNRQDLSVLIISKNPNFVIGNDLSINLNDCQPSETTITKLYGDDSSFDESRNKGRIQNN